MAPDTNHFNRALYLLQKCGPVYGSKLISQAIWRRIYPPARRARIQWQRQQQDDAAWDQAFGVDTCGDQWLSDSGVPVGESARGNGIYRPVNRALFEHGMNSLAIDHSKYTFIDYGSGKGKALFMAALYPFNEIIGIEYASELHRIAQANIERFHNDRQRCHKLRSLLCDAMIFQPPLTPLVCFFFNPFDAATLSQVLKNIHSSWQSSKRRIWLVYVNQRDIKESLTVFQQVPNLITRFADKNAAIFTFSETTDAYHETTSHPESIDSSYAVRFAPETGA